MTYDERVSNIIAKLKQYKEKHPGLTFDSISNATGLSLSTITRMFSEDSESHSFRPDSIQAISEFLLEDENDDTALAIYRYNESYIKDLEDKLIAERDRYEKKLEKERTQARISIEFLKDQVGKKDKRIDYLMYVNEVLMKRLFDIETKTKEE